jgi:virginiamycin B lyase
MRPVLSLLAILPLAAWAQLDLPAGSGRDTVETVCIGCHELRRVTMSGYDRDGWHNVLHMMVNAGAQLPDDRFEPVADYLTRNFPPKPKPEAVVIPGAIKVSIKEWPVPTPGTRPHDPLSTPDGALWYSGQMANVLGRLDPATGKFMEYKLPANSGPHGLVADGQGDIWYTANFAAYVGKLDPKSGEVKQYPMPDPAAKDPHTAIFDQKGILWFTVQGANRVGRLDPKSGEVRLVILPQPRSNPYGMVVDSKGFPYFAEFGGNRIGRIDPDTMAIKEYALPHQDSRPRRIAIDGNDVIWYSDYSRGYLGRLDARTGEVKEFASPGGPNAQPYGITWLDGAVWYSESGVAPNTLVRFDPGTARFQSWVIPSGGGVVRNMMPGVGKSLVLACSGVNGVALVEVK